MKKRLIALSFALLLLTSCGESKSDRVTDPAEIDGSWSTTMGNVLTLDIDSGTYTYRTFYGRTGQGEYGMVSGSKLMLDFNGMMYDFELRDDGVLRPFINGSTDREEIGAWTFVRSDVGAGGEFDKSVLDGAWSSPDGTELTIDTYNGGYSAKLPGGGVSEGTLNDDFDGRGYYLYNSGERGYFVMGDANDSFKLCFGEADPGAFSENGELEQVFYREGTDIPDADKYEYIYDEDSSTAWMYDGVDTFYVGMYGYEMTDGALTHDGAPVKNLW